MYEHEQPGSTQAQSNGFRTIRHEPHGGFCTVCGSVWPCARAIRLQPTLFVL